MQSTAAPGRAPAMDGRPGPSGGQAALALGALGVVFGDIGTSPLYAFKEVLAHHAATASPGAPTSAPVLGMLSLVFWALTLVVTVKYLAFVMRADNQGEGGILALLALIPEPLRTARPGRVAPVAALVLFGAALLYGDGAITPAISVLSAVEGLELVTSALRPAVVPLTCVILVALFAIQRFGTAGIGRLFGPVMLLWFVSIGALGAVRVAQHPAILAALSPHHAATFLRHSGWHGFTILGAVVLVVTGGEALYADMGHFGARPIRRAWMALAMPSLVACYFGQGALVLAEPRAAAQPFFALVPAGAATVALVLLSTVATVIASQALISGAFSLTQQAVQLGFFPRVTIRHTSADAEGQIYVPEINLGLAVACVALVLVFRASSGLAAAYGIAVCGTMTITSVAYAVVARRRWQWPRSMVLLVLTLFLGFDLPFLAANLTKLGDGGYVPVALAAVLFAVMLVWHIGRSRLAQYAAEHSPPWSTWLATLETDFVSRSPSVAVVMASASQGVPPMLVHHAKRIQVLPATVIILTIRFERVPHVPERDRFASIDELGQGFHRVVVHYGYMQSADVPAIVAEAIGRLRLQATERDVTYFIGRESFIAGPGGHMGPWLESIFAFLSRNARDATSYFRLPPEQVVELGTQIDL